MPPSIRLAQPLERISYPFLYENRLEHASPPPRDLSAGRLPRALSAKPALLQLSSCFDGPRLLPNRFPVLPVIENLIGSNQEILHHSPKVLLNP
jgi:hypothetical protein